MWGILILLQATTISCITFAKEKGLLIVREDKIKLRNVEGKEYKLKAGTDQQYLRNLSGCIVSASGFSFFNEFYVDSWFIQDAGTGSAPYLGKLKRQGIQWTIHDHNTKGVIFLDSISKHIRPSEGRIILVGGYVVGPNRIRVVSARYIDDED